MLWYVQADGVCKRHTAEASAADISHLPDLALELIFSAQLPNLARPACVCSVHLDDQRCNSNTLLSEPSLIGGTSWTSQHCIKCAPATLGM